MKDLMRFLPDGSVLAIWNDRIDLRRLSLKPQRASRVEVIPDGARAGLFHVDFSPLADATGDETKRVCLVQTFARHDDAIIAEIAWLMENYIGAA